MRIAPCPPHDEAPDGDAHGAEGAGDTPYSLDKGGLELVVDLAKDEAQIVPVLRVGVTQPPRRAPAIPSALGRQGEEEEDPPPELLVHSHPFVGGEIGVIALPVQPDKENGLIVSLVLRVYVDQDIVASPVAFPLEAPSVNDAVGAGHRAGGSLAERAGGNL